MIIAFFIIKPTLIDRLYFETMALLFRTKLAGCAASRFNFSNKERKESNQKNLGQYKINLYIISLQLFEQNYEIGSISDIGATISVDETFLYHSRKPKKDFNCLRLLLLFLSFFSSSIHMPVFGSGCVQQHIQSLPQCSLLLLFHHLSKFLNHR